MQKKNSGGSISGSVDLRSEPAEPQMSNMDKMAASLLIHAIESKDLEGICQAFKALMDIYESQPHQGYGE